MFIYENSSLYFRFIGVFGSSMRHDFDDLSEKSKGLLEFELRTTCRGGGMADAADLKSVVRKDVRVRLPPSAPLQHFLLQQGLGKGSHTCTRALTLRRSHSAIQQDLIRHWWSYSVEAVFRSEETFLHP